MPIYPEVTRAEGSFKRTYDPNVFIESRTETADPDAPDIVYVNFGQKLRWRQTGNCNRCGIGDFNLAADGSGAPDFGDYNIKLVERKRVGEVNSVLDLDYETRLDYPCAPNYDRQMRKMAAIMGLPYVCGLRFKTLTWIY